MLTSSGASLHSKKVKLHYAANVHQSLAPQLEGVYHAYPYCAVFGWQRAKTTILGRYWLPVLKKCRALTLILTDHDSVFWPTNGTAPKFAHASQSR